MADAIEEICDRLVRLEFHAIPRNAIAAAKRSIIDLLAVAWAGAAAETCADVRRQIIADAGRPECSVLVYGDRLPAQSAVYLNSLFASALDYDGIHDRAIVHSDIIVLPAAFAMAERSGCSGEDFLSAFIAGTDLACRLGIATNKSSGWFYTSVFGVFGAAAAAGRLLGLDREQLRDALSLAFLQSCGTYQAVLERTLAKRHLSALAARSGVFAALLAQSGVSGPKEVLQGRYGLFGVYDEADVCTLLSEYGERFEGTNMTLKLYPACFCSHAAIQGTLEIVREHNITMDDIESVSVTLSEYMHRLVGNPFDPSRNPQVVAQFSVQYAVAASIIHRRFTLAELETSVILDPRARDLSAKVHVRVDPSNEGTAIPADVVISTKNKRAFRKHIDTVPGMPNQPLSSSELLTKFQSCLAMSSAPRTPGAVLIEKIQGIENIGDMRTFFDGILGFADERSIPGRHALNSGPEVLSTGIPCSHL